MNGVLLAPPVLVDGVTKTNAATTSDGDGDVDSDVDSDDFLIWQANFGTQMGATPKTGDANGDGAVNGDDFLIWQAQFGSSTLAPAAAPIPEPTTAAIVALLWAVLATRRRTN